LFQLPLLVGGIITGVVSILLLVVQDRRGQRMFERVITGLLLVIAIGFLTSLFVDPPSPADVAAGLVPRFDSAESVLLATAMLGATVMPHAVYLHSGLARDRHGHPDIGPRRKGLLRATRIDVTLAMLVAGAVNLSMLLVAATRTVLAKTEITLWRLAARHFHIEIWRSFAPYLQAYLDVAARGG